MHAFPLPMVNIPTYVYIAEYTAIRGGCVYSVAIVTPTSEQDINFFLSFYIDELFLEHF